MLAGVVIYQIGDMPLHIHGELHDYDVQDTGKTLELLWSPKLLRPNSQFLIKPKTFNLNGVLYPTCAHTADTIKTKLDHLVGLETDIIGYVMTGCCANGLGCCSCCACSGKGGCEPLWLHTRGTLKKSDLKRKKYPADVSLGIEINTFWKPLNNFVWEFTDDVNDPYYDHDLTASLLPSCDMLYDECKCGAWIKRRQYAPLEIYNPDVWDDMLTYRRYQYPKTHDNRQWDTQHLHEKIFVNEKLWNAPPLSIYQFRNVAAETQVGFTITRVSQLWELETETITIDVTGLNANLVAKGLPVLNNLDRIIVGDVRPMPAFVMTAGGGLITNVQVPVTYTGFFAGYLGRGENQLDFNLGNAGEATYLHIYRRL